VANDPRPRSRVLVVDAHQDCREACATFLTLCGFAVEEAETGTDAFEAAVRTLPDVIVTDLVLRGMDGWELTWRLRNTSVTSTLPIIILTAVTLPWCRCRAEHAGCSAFLAKPCPPETLVAEIGRLLGAATGGFGRPPRSAWSPYL
jgi:CheY-like chemotaxis protein